MRAVLDDLRPRGGPVLSRLPACAAGVLAVALLASCHRQDAAFRQQVVGTWENSEGQMRVYLAGDFRSNFSQSSARGPKTWNYEGLWEVQNGFFIATITNSFALNTTNFEPAGAIDRYKIIQLDQASLQLELNGRTLAFHRR